MKKVQLLVAVLALCNFQLDASMKKAIVTTDRIIAITGIVSIIQHQAKKSYCHKIHEAFNKSIALYLETNNSSAEITVIEQMTEPLNQKKLVDCMNLYISPYPRKEIKYIMHTIPHEPNQLGISIISEKPLSQRARELEKIVKQFERRNN